jgi:hypothetical protein
VEEDINPEHRLMSLPNSDELQSKGLMNESNRLNSQLSPVKNFSPKRKMFDLDNIKNFQ